jgi:hypothetical protein
VLEAVEKLTTQPDASAGRRHPHAPYLRCVGIEEHDSSAAHDLSLKGCKEEPAGRLAVKRGGLIPEFRSWW